MPALLTFTAVSATGQSVQVKIVSPPSVCPRCYHGIDAIHRYARFDQNFPLIANTQIVVQVVYQCPRAECAELFFGWFSSTPERLGRGVMDINAFQQTPLPLKSTGPLASKKHEFPKEIGDVSPKFIEIYNQAAAAEQYGLEEIAGPGYGKALEFLVKDYLSHKDPEATADIRKEFLATAIANRVDDPRLKRAARGAAWLRNDETHYERRWVGKDLADLKVLIALAVNWIHSSILTDVFAEEMQLDGNSPSQGSKPT
jgi:hypothetical protein